MARDSAMPAAATAQVKTATPVMPQPGCATIQPPITMPMRIAIEVPISTRPLPPTSSASFRFCGR
jgi:hypothetical protein